MRKIYSILFATIAAIVLLSSCKKDKNEIQPTGKTTVLAFAASDPNQLSGSATIEENTDHSFNILINLSNTIKDSTIYIDVHSGNFGNPFSKQAIDLGSIKCTGGPVSNTTKYISNINLPDQTKAAITYDSILTYKGFINLSYFKTPHNVSTSVAHVDL